MAGKLYWLVILEAERLRGAQENLSDHLLLIMREYQDPPVHNSLALTVLL